MRERVNPRPDRPRIRPGASLMRCRPSLRQEVVGHELVVRDVGLEGADLDHGVLGQGDRASTSDGSPRTSSRRLRSRPRSRGTLRTVPFRGLFEAVKLVSRGVRLISGLDGGWRLGAIPRTAFTSPRPREFRSCRLAASIPDVRPSASSPDGRRLRETPAPSPSQAHGHRRARRRRSCTTSGDRRPVRRPRVSCRAAGARLS